MNAKDFKHMIRQLIQEELKTTLPEVLDEYFEKNGTEEMISESKKELSAPPVGGKRRLDELFGVNKSVSTSKPMKRYTSDPVLNKILNETVPKKLTGDNPYSPASLSEPMVSDISEGILLEETSTVSEIEPEMSKLTRDFSIHSSHSKSP